MTAIMTISFIAAFALSALLTPLARAAARRLKFYDLPGARKIHAAPIPYGGGAAIFLAFVLPLAGAYLLAWKGAEFGISIPPAAERRVSGMFYRLPQFLCVLGGGAVLFMMGLLDDWRKLNKWLKLAVQAAVVTALFASGIRITLFTHGVVANYLLTLFWMVGIINAFNLLDNMDGLSAGVAFIASIIFFMIASTGGQDFVAAMLIVLAGALLGFLLFNFHPATIFMGDAGSYFTGYLLAVLTTLSTFYRPETGSAAHVFFIPLMILAIPIFDTLSVIFIRLKEGRPVTEGDRSHFSHRLLRLGLGVRQVVVTIYLTAIAMGLGAVLLSELGGGLYTAISLVQAIVIFSVIVILESGAAKKNG